MIHPASELRLGNPTIGYGVVATRFIPKGTITWVYDDLDQVVAPARLAEMPPLLRASVEKYSYFNGRGDRVLCWDHSRFVNHSCNATSLAPGFDLEIAVRDIQEGEEITDDYGLLNLDTSFECACGWEHCRGTIGPEDFEAHAARWDGLAVDAMRHFQRVDQPLWELVHEKDAIQAVLEGRAPLPSCRVHRMQALRAEAAVA